MAELLVRTVDKVNPKDPEKDAQCLKRGEVVVIMPDGHPWSQRERNNPDWQLVQIPGMSVEDANIKFTQPPFVDPKIAGEEAMRNRKRRAIKIDLDALVAHAEFDKYRSDPEASTKVLALSAETMDSVSVLKEGVPEAQRPLTKEQLATRAAERAAAAEKPV